MKLVVFGLTISSSWGNGHATLWRGLCRALTARGHRVIFFERDTDYYRTTRDLHEIEGGRLVLYPDWSAVRAEARDEVADADAVMVTSYCPDGRAASELVLGEARGTKVFYDLDTPVTLAALEAGEELPYILPQGLGGFDLVLSYTGGRALDLLRERLGATRVAPLYGHVDPLVHRPVSRDPRYCAGLSYLGTHSADRADAVRELFVEPARARPGTTFTLGGSLYPNDFGFPPNVVHCTHVPPADHAAFYCSSRLTLNVTRSTMARLGHCPSGRLFEAAACSVPIVSDWFEGLDRFFEPGDEIIVAKSREDVLFAMSESDAQLRRLAARAHDRVLEEHRASRRAAELLDLLGSTGSDAKRAHELGSRRPTTLTEA